MSSNLPTRASTALRWWEGLSALQKAGLAAIPTTLGAIGGAIVGALSQALSVEIHDTAVAWWASVGDFYVTHSGVVYSLALLSFSLLVATYYALTNHWRLVHEVKDRAEEHEQAVEEGARQAEEAARALAWWSPGNALRFFTHTSSGIPELSSGTVEILIYVQNMSPKLLTVEGLTFVAATLTTFDGNTRKTVAISNGDIEAKDPKNMVLYPVTYGSHPIAFRLKLTIPRAAYATEQFGLIELVNGRVEVYDGPPPSKTHALLQNFYCMIKLQ